MMRYYMELGNGDLYSMDECFGELFESDEEFAAAHPVIFESGEWFKLKP